jgi:hypothetical protein
VAADVLTYTVDELRAIQNRGGRFARVLREETVWLVGKPPR